jgi:hypothetical protein
VPDNDGKDKTFWNLRADEMRGIANTFKDAQAKWELLWITAAYERLGEKTEGAKANGDADGHADDPVRLTSSHANL